MMKDSRVYGLLLGRLFSDSASGLFMMALPWLMLKQEAGGHYVAIMALLCTCSSFVMTPVFSTWIDRSSRKYLLLLVQCFQFLAACLVLFSGLYGNANLLVLSIAQFIFWVSSDLDWSATNALVHENFTEKEYPKISGYKEVVSQAVQIFSGAMGIYVLEVWNTVYFSAFACSFSLFSILFFLFMSYQMHDISFNQKSFRKTLIETKTVVHKHSDKIVLLALSCLSYPVLTYLSKLIPIYFAQNMISGAWFAAWEVAYGVGAIVCGFSVVWILKKYHEINLIRFSILSLSFLLFVMGMNLTPIGLVLFTLLYGFFSVLDRISRINYMNKVIHPRERGRLDGVLKMWSTSIQSGSYVLIAVLVHYNQVGYGFMMAAVILFTAGVYMLTKNMPYNQTWPQRPFDYE